MAIETTNVGYWIVDSKGFLLEANKTYSDIIGYTVSELKGMHITQLEAKQSEPEVNEHLAKISEQRYAMFETRHRHKDGHAIDVQISTSFNQDTHQFVSFIRDITERKRNEEVAVLFKRRAEALLALPLAAEQLDETTFMQRGQEFAEDLTSSLIAFIHFINDDEETIELVTWSRRTLDHYCHAAFDKHYPVSHAGIWADAFRQKRVVVFNDYPSYPDKRGLPDGHSVLTRLISVPVLENGKVVMLTGVGNKATNYTETDVETIQLISDSIWRLVQRRRAANSLLNMAMKFRTLFDSSADAIMLLDENGIFDCNPSSLRIFRSSSREDFINKHPSLLSPPTQPGGLDSVTLANQHIASAFKHGSFMFEWEHRRVNGIEFPAEVLLTVMELDGKQVLQATIRDITERKHIAETLRRERNEQAQLVTKLKEAHDHLLQSDKMASIGQLAAGVAHEINNPIGYVNSNLGTLESYVQNVFKMLEAYERAAGSITDAGVRANLEELKKKLDIYYLRDDLQSLLTESKEGINRVRAIVQNLKDFSHVGASDEWHLSNLHKGLDSTLSIVNNELKYKAEIIKEYGEIPEVECIASQINQVFLNLLVNAAHAIEVKGTITIRTGTEAEEVWIDIIDTGQGIAPQHLKKIFDPFFTTKPVGKGTGLGLSLSYGIIEKHRGRIEVQSEVGKGSKFRVWLPITHINNEQT